MKHVSQCPIVIIHVSCQIPADAHDFMGQDNNDGDWVGKWRAVFPLLGYMLLMLMVMMMLHLSCHVWSLTVYAYPVYVLVMLSCSIMPSVFLTIRHNRRNDEYVAHMPSDAIDILLIGYNK